jgi:DNA-binding MarR family transcriptional regulator
VKNVSRRDDPVKGDDRAGAAATPDAPVVAPGRQALEISRLLVEVLRIGPVGRLPAADAPPHDVVTTSFTSARTGEAGRPEPGPIASHAIRAAIHVYEHGPETIGQLATGIGISQGWASRVVDEMERAGYLERQRDPQDRRVVRVSLVPTAVERVERAYRWRGDAVEAALQGMSAEGRTAVEQFLRRFVEAARGDG